MRVCLDSAAPDFRQHMYGVHVYLKRTSESEAVVLGGCESRLWALAVPASGLVVAGFALPAAVAAGAAACVVVEG